MPDTIEDIKARLDIADVIREYIPLQNAGGNFKACCPFHNEKTPSFMVNATRQRWHCFGGCNEGGDMFTFVMKYEGIEFAEALRVLAAKAGVSLPHHDPRLHNHTTRLFDVLRTTADYFRQALLRAPQTEAIRRYVNQRISDPSLIDEFCIGASLPEESALSTFLLSRKFTAQEILQAGLAIKKDRGYGFLDRFRNRLMIPICDIRGNVIGFGGRTLEEGGGAAKYINSPQTALYDKSATVYNLDRAKSEIKARDCAIIVEGYMDVFAVYGSGMKNVVASSGTALTIQQLRLIKRFSPHVLFAFDMDAAGIAATGRGIELALAEGMDVKIIILPHNQDGTKKYKDPDECIRCDVAAWRQSVENAHSFIQFRMDTVLTPNVEQDAFEKKRAVREVLTSIALLSDRIEQDHWIRKLSSCSGISEGLLWEELSKTMRVFPKQSSIQQMSTQKIVPATNEPSQHMREELLLAVLLKYPEFLFSVMRIVSGVMFQDTRSRMLYERLMTIAQSIQETPEMVSEMVATTCADDESDHFRLLADKEWGDTHQNEIAATAETLAYVVRNEYCRIEIARLQQCMREAELAGDAGAIAMHARRFHDLQNM